MQKFKTFLTVIGAVTILVLAANSAVYAATGGKFILGKTNKANKVSILKRTTNGPALNLTTTTSSSAPLSTNGRGKVGNLNADLLDGQDSSVLRTRTYSFSSTFTNRNSSTLTLSLPNGSYLVTYSNFFSGLGTSEGIQCYIRQNNTGTSDLLTGWSALVYVNDPSWKPALSGSGLVTVSATSTIQVTCQAADTGTFSADSTSPMQVTATPTKVLSNSALTAARTAPGGARLTQK